MPNLSLIRIALFISFACPLWAQTPSENDGFNVVRQDEKITMYERWKPFPGTTTNSREIKCVFHATTTLDNMLAHIYQDSKVTTWQKNLIEYKVTKKNDSAWVAYSYYKIPWPLTDQDYLLNYSLSKKNENQVILSFKHLVDDKLQAIRDGVDRKPTVGRWELEKTANGKIKVTYIITSLPVSFPRVVTDGIVRNNIMNTINTLITVVENKK
jgi:hypothetical protein